MSVPQRSTHNRSRSSLVHKLVLTTYRDLLLTAAKSTNQGLTLIECLVAVIIATITVVAITPPIFLATASRIQSRRVEQANQIAQAEVDRVRGIVERGRYVIADLPPVGVATGIKSAPVGTSVATGTTILSPATCTANYPRTPIPNALTLVPVDVDGDCQPEFMMQVFRTTGCVLPGVVDPNAPPVSFALGVRVYSYNPNDSSAMPTLLVDRATLGLTAGRKDGTNNRSPLQAVYSSVSITNDQKAISCVAAN